MDNNSEGKIGALIFLIVMIICYSIGVIVLCRTAANQNSYNEYRREICQAISITTEEYINCNQMNWEDILTKIPKVKGINNDNN